MDDGVDDPAASTAEPPAGLFGSPSPDESVRPFRTDPMGDEVDGMPTFEGGDGSIPADLDRHMEGFGR